ncbi:unnamed protein product, partial [marine sediment metagenome]
LIPAIEALTEAIKDDWVPFRPDDEITKAVNDPRLLLLQD